MVAPNHPISQRPVSGFLATSSKLDEAPLIRDWNAYGSVSIELKRSVKNNASFTLNDSLTSPSPDRRGKEISWQPSKLLDLNIASIVSLIDDTPESIRDRVKQFSKVKSTRDINAIKFKEYYDNYMEIGIHGGLTTDGIAKIIFRKGLPSESTVEWANANNIEIEVLDRE